MQDKLKILLADDDDVFRMLVGRAFRSDPTLSERCELACVGDGTDAVDYFFGRGGYEDRALYPRPDVVILDERMIRMDGLEVLRRIKADARSRGVPVCMFSTSADERWKSKCYEAGATACSEKPFDSDLLPRKLRMMVDFFSVVMGLPCSLE